MDIHSTNRILITRYFFNKDYYNITTPRKYAIRNKKNTYYTGKC